MPCSRAASRIVTPSCTLTGEPFSVALISFMAVNFKRAQDGWDAMSSHYIRVRLCLSTFSWVPLDLLAKSSMKIKFGSVCSEWLLAI